MKWSVRLDLQNRRKVLAESCLFPKSFSAQTSPSCPPSSSASASPDRSSSGPRSSSAGPRPEIKINWNYFYIHVWVSPFSFAVLQSSSDSPPLFCPNVLSFSFHLPKRTKIKFAPNLAAVQQRFFLISFSLGSTLHHSYSILGATWPLKRNSHMLSFLWIIYEIWPSFTNYLWSYFCKVNPWQSGSTGTRLGVYHRKKKWGKNTEEHIYMTHFGPLLPNCKSGMLFLGQVFGLACKKAKSWLDWRGNSWVNHINQKSKGFPSIRLLYVAASTDCRELLC